MIDLELKPPLQIRGGGNVLENQRRALGGSQLKVGQSFKTEPQFSAERAIQRVETATRHSKSVAQRTKGSWILEK